MEKPSKLTTKKLIIIIAAVVAVCGLVLGALVFSRNNIKEVASEDDYGYVNPDETKAETDAGFVIDGVLDEEQYQKNNWLYLSNKEGGADVEIAMTSYYGEKGMYFVYDVTEGNPIYVNTARASYLNSCIEMYLAPSTVTSLSGNSLFEIDLLPTGDMTFKKSNGKGGYVNVATTDDKMAVLGATTKGGEVNSEECYGYCLELFIPWDYMDKFDLDSDAMKDSFVYVDPAHITSFNFAGTDTNVDRYWYYFAQQHGAGFSDVYQYFRFDENGVQGSVPVELQAGEHYTIEGTKAVIPGMKTNITITPEAGYTLHSILINGEEYIKKANFNEDGSVALNVRGVKEGLKISATAVIATEGNKTLSGTVIANKLGGGSLKDVSASYTGPTGEKPLELDSNGKFTLTDLKQGYYTITIEKEGYEKLVRSIYLNRDMEVELSLEYQTFAVTKGSCWILDDQNNGVLHKFGGSGNLLSNDKYDKFTVEANFKYDTDLPNEADTDAFTQQRQGLRIVFSNEKAWHIDVMNENGKYIVQYAKHSGDNSVFGWKGIHEMTEAEVAKFTSEDGIKLEVQRDGKYANVYLDGKLIAVEVLDDEYVKLSAQIGFEFWVANREIMDVPYKITTANSVNLKSTLFKTAKGWDVSGQYNGLLTMPEGGRGDLKFVNKYANMDLTLRVKDYDDAEKKAARTDVLFVFDNGAHISFGITSDDKGAWIQSLNQSADKVDGKATQFIYKRYKSWGALSEEEFAQYKDGGVDFRIVRYGTEVTLYIGDRMVAVADLTSNNSGVTADMPATVTIRHYDDAGVKVEMPFELTQEFNLVKITTIAGKNGSVTTEKQQYFVGDTVKVLAGKDDYYCTWMKVNGKEVDINWDYTYSFTATEKEYTVEGDLAKKVFAASKEWNLLQQNAGKLIVPNSDGDSGWVNTVEKTYKDVDLKFTLKDTKSEDKNFRTGVRLTFTNDEYVTFSVTNDTKDGSYILQNMGGSILNWKNPGYTLNAEQTAGITGDGLEMRIVRIGSGVDIYLGGEHAYGFDLSTNVDGEDSEVEDKAAQIAVRHYGNTGVDAEIGFEFAEAEKPVKITIEDSKNGTAVTKQMHYFEGQTVIASGKGEEGYYCSGLEVDGKDVELNWDGTYSFTAEKEGHTIKGSFSESVFKDNSGWDLVEQNAGLIGLPENRTGNSSWLELYDQYGDIDLTLTARDYIGDGTDACTVVRFVIDGKEASFRIGHMDGTYKVQTYGNSSLYKWSYSFNLTNEEIKEYQSEAGLDFRVVRKGTDIYLYAGDRRVCNVFDLTYDKDSVETGITADMPASIFIKQDGNLGHEVEIEYVIKTEVPDEAKITIADGIANGTITTEFSKYLAGDKVGLVTTGADGYYYDSLKANDKDVKVDENTLLPTFTAKTENTVTGSFAPAVFKNGGGGKWNLVNHNVGILALANSNGDSSWLDSCDSTYRGVSVNVQDKIGNTKQFRMQIYFAFDNGETFRIRLHDTDKDGKYRIQTMEDSITPTWKPYYELSDDEVDKLQGEDGINLRVEIVGVIANIYLDDVNVCQISLMKDRDGKDTGVGSEAASVTLRLYGNTGYNTLVPYALMKAKEAKVNLTSESTDGGSIEVVTQNNYVNGYVTVKPVAKDGYGCTGLKVNGNNAILEADGTYTFLATEENTVEATFKRKVILNINVPTDAAYGTITPKADYYVGDNVELAVDTADGYNCKDFVVKQGGKEVLSEKVIFKDGTYSFKAEKYNYTVEGSFVEKIFNEKTNNAYNDWDLTGQYEGVMTHNVSSSNSSWLVFNKQYVNSDITLTVIEHDETGNDSNSNASRTSVQYSIGDKYWTSFSVFHWNNTYQIAGRTNDSLNQGDANKSGVVYYSLSKDEIALLKSKEGIEFRVIRNGTLVDIYLDGRLVVEDIDLTGDGAYSNVITATTPTDVKIKRDDDKNIQTVIPFTISEALPETVTLNIPTTIDNGTITKGKDSYIVGEKVTLTVAGNNNTYYYDSLTVNDKEVMVENDGTYTFTATEKVYDINGSFAQTIFSIDDTEQPLKYWNLTNQHKGVIVQRDDYTGVTNVYANFAGTHTNSDVTLIIKNHEGTDTDGCRTAVGYYSKNPSVNKGYSIIKEPNGTYTLGRAYSGEWTKRLYTLNESETKLITEGDGIEFRVVKDGNQVYMYLDGNLRHTETLTELNDSNATNVWIKHWDDTGRLIEIPFTFSSSAPKTVQFETETDNNGTITLSKETSADAKVVISESNPLIVGQRVTVKVAGKDNTYYYNSLKIKDEISGKEEDVTVNDDGTYTFTATSEQYTIKATFAQTIFSIDNAEQPLKYWNLTNQHKGVIVQRDDYTGVTNVYANFAGTHTNSDVTLIIKNHEGTDTDGCRTAVGYYSKNPSVNKGYSIIKEPNGTYTLGRAYSGEWTKRLYTLNESETKLITEGDGIEFRVVKDGNQVYMYLDGNLRHTETLTELDDSNATNVWVKHWDDTGRLIKIPFTFSSSAPEKVTINVLEDIVNGTVKTYKQTDASITDKTYIVGEKIILVPAANSGYEFDSLSVDGVEVELSSDGTYTFTATKSSYEVTASFIEDAPMVEANKLFSVAGFFYNNTATKVTETNLADPFVLDNTNVDGYYYMYGTYGKCYCYRSKDMVNWEKVGDTLVLSEVEMQAVSKDIWAPEVVYEDTTDDGVANGTYYMFFSATASDETDELLYVAVSDRPDGGFKLIDFTDEASCGTGNKHGYSTNTYKEEYAKYLMLDPELYKKFSDENGALFEDSREVNGYIGAIDPHPYVAANGKKYLFWVDSHGADRICGVEMENWLSPKWDTAKVLTYHGYSTVAAWEQLFGRGEKDSTYELESSINEGPVITEHNGKVYLTFSVNKYDTNSYQVIQAVSSNGILGDYRKLTEAEGGILLSGKDAISGTGHHSFVTVGDQTFIVYHRHNDYKNPSAQRNHAIDEIKWVTIKDKDGNDLDIMTVNGPTSTEQPMIEVYSDYKNIAEEAKITGSKTASYLNDGLYSFNNYSKETSITNKTTFVFDLTQEENKTKTVSALMIYNSKSAETCFDKITKIELICEEKDGTVVRYIKDLEALCDAEGKVIPGAASYAAVEDANVRYVRITVEVPEGQESVGISEVKILSPKE